MTEQGLDGNECSNRSRLSNRVSKPSTDWRSWSPNCATRRWSNATSDSLQERSSRAIGSASPRTG